MSIFLISVISSWFFGQKTEPMYRSSTTLYMGGGGAPLAEVTGTGVTFWGGGGQDIATQLELIKSYNNLKDVAVKLKIIPPEETDEDKIESVVAGLRGEINVEEQEGTSLIVITATNDNAVRARDIAATVAEVFIDKSWERKTLEASTTKKFVEGQIAKLETSISDIKKKLKALGLQQPMFGQMVMEPPTGAVELRTRLAKLKYEVTSLRERYTENYPGIISRDADIKELEAQIATLPAAERETSLDVDMLDVDKLRNELDINQRLYVLLKDRYERARLTEASKTKDIEVVNPAVVPKAPMMEVSNMNVFLGGLIGLVLALVAAFITESMDTSIGTIEDVEEYLRMPVLGVIPKIDISRKEETDYWKEPPPPEEQKRYSEIMGRLITQYKPKSPIAEAYRNLQTYIKFSGLDKFGNCMMFTSAGIREGKTITSVNSALSMAQLGYKVLLVDADLRRPSVHRVFGIDRDIGLTEVVLGTFKMEDVIKTMDDIMMGNIKSSVIMKTYGMENLSVITAGHLAANPTEILSSQNITEFIKEAKSKFQVVFFDSAPILPVTDSCILSSKMDGVILVYEVGRVSRGALRRSKMQLENAKGRPIGVVLNSMRSSDMKFGSPFYYYYQKYYGEEHEGQSGEKKSFLGKFFNRG